MNPKQEFTPSCFSALCWATTNSWELVLRSCAVAVLAVTCLGCGEASGVLGLEPESNADLPEISAYLYTPPKVDGCHIHFHVMVDGRNGFLAPAIFDQKIVKGFHDKCDGFRWSNDGKAIPPCMGYRIGAKENPFGTGAKDEL